MSHAEIDMVQIVSPPGMRMPLTFDPHHTLYAFVDVDSDYDVALVEAAMDEKGDGLTLVIKGRDNNDMGKIPTMMKKRIDTRAVETSVPRVYIVT
ncbi:hypothetical protein O0I10_008260 [Lichtheimia ornata]|uniref:Uncharacterized protein n=1 Tax=Lichtheimia ornata TaxID=688661 RepID=A0AAD7UZU3_9FUNG|nr:uncharacterized protein O0I10_008260 [Lichtheimia ornata]KAJ8656038.1 hypothetical protein O0I10_008260 [Lichtheimia ornata]